MQNATVNDVHHSMIPELSVAFGVSLEQSLTSLQCHFARVIYCVFEVKQDSGYCTLFEKCNVFSRTRVSKSFAVRAQTGKWESREVMIEFRVRG